MVKTLQIERRGETSVRISLAPPLTYQRENMALETLKGIEEIGGFKITRDGEKDKFIYIIEDNGDNGIAFKIQNGPVKEVGVNGCQVDTMIEVCKKMIEGLNEKFPCQENILVLEHLEQALNWLNIRKKRREQQGIEGTSQEKA